MTTPVYKRQKKSSKDQAYSPVRIWLMLGFWCCCALLLAWRAVDLHIVQHDFLAHQGDLRNLRVEPLAAHRGVITDRDGRPLAVSTPVISLWANPREVLDNPEAPWHKLNENTLLDDASLWERVTRHQHREFIYIARHLAPEDAEKILNFDLPGIHAMTEYRRYYPAGEVTSHLVGFTNIDGVGQEGIELAMEKDLRATPGKKRVIKDHNGRVIHDLEVLQEVQSGVDIALSIDLRLQHLAYRKLLSAVHQHRAQAGSAVVLDAQNGEILAMVNQPGYNPNNRVNLAIDAVRNRAVTDVFEPGSTVKPITVATALESGLVKRNHTIDTRPGHVRVANKMIRDHRNYGVVTLPQLLAKSSNVATTKLALSMDEQLLPDYMEKFGFGFPAGIRFPGESSGSLPIRPKWHELETATLSYGYGLSVTTLQLAGAYAVLANRGMRAPLSLVPVDNPPLTETVISPETARTLVEMMESAFSDEGTARRARVPGYRVAGKTGTVHKLTPGGGYAENRYLALFAGIAPVENPRYVVVVVVDDPGTDEYFGGQVAAPVFASIMDAVLRLRHVVPDNPSVIYAGGKQQEGQI